MRELLNRLQAPLEQLLLALPGCLLLRTNAIHARVSTRQLASGPRKEEEGPDLLPLLDRLLLDRDAPGLELLAQAPHLLLHLRHVVRLLLLSSPPQVLPVDPWLAPYLYTF